MIAEVISIGDEITSGQRLDTNSQWISQQLGNLGIQVVFHTTVADSLPANIAVFKNSFQRADLIICTGGLGPTADDLTRQALADALGVGLYRDEKSLDHIRQLFARRDRPMPSQNEIQADFPEGSQPIFNRNGSAPGIYMPIERDGHIRHLMAFPGVPAELKEMFSEFAQPKIVELLGPDRKFIVNKVIRCFGIGESDLESRLPDLINRGQDPQVGITASGATISLRIHARGNSIEECHRKIEKVNTVAEECLGELIFGEGDDELQHVVHRELNRRKQTLAIAEIGTGGFVSHLFSEIDPKGDVYLGSWVARNLKSACGLCQEEIQPESSAKILAEKVKQVFQTDFGLAIDAFPDDPSDKLQLAVATRRKTLGVKSPFGGHPSILLPRSAKQAMNLLRLWLRKNPWTDDSENS